jgi:hypothetical protein
MLWTGTHLSFLMFFHQWKIHKLTWFVPFWSQYSTFNSIAQSYGAVAAQDRQGPADPSGFTFLNCKVTGTGSIFLGRAMGPYSRIIYVYSYFDNIIDPLGWDNWSGDTSKNWSVASLACIICLSFIPVSWLCKGVLLRFSLCFVSIT